VQLNKCIADILSCVKDMSNALVELHSGGDTSEETLLGFIKDILRL